jgi:hypothetical protein
MRLEIATEPTEDAEEALCVGSRFGVLGAFGGNFALGRDSEPPSGCRVTVNASIPGIGFFGVLGGSR